MYIIMCIKVYPPFFWILKLRACRVPLTMCILRDVSGVALTEEVLISNNTALVEYNTAVFMRTEHARASRSQVK